MQLKKEVIRKLPAVRILAGETVVTEGSRDGVLYFLESGTVEIVKEGVSITTVKDSGAVFGEMSVLLDAPHTATVRTLNDCTFRVVENPEEFMIEEPGIAAYVATILAKRLDSLNKYLVDTKSQFQDQDGHVSMVDNILETLMTKHPRTIERREQSGP